MSQQVAEECSCAPRQDQTEQTEGVMQHCQGEEGQGGCEEEGAGVEWSEEAVAEGDER